MIRLVILMILFLSPATPLPAPQDKPSATPLPAPQDKPSDDALDYYYDDGTADKVINVVKTTTARPSGLSELVSMIRGLGSNAVKFLTSKETIDRVGEVIRMGTNVTAEMVRTAAPRVQEAVKQGPQSLVEFLDVQKSAAHVVRTAGAVATTVVEETPKVVKSGSRLAGSLAKATNDTAPLVVNGIKEFTNILPFLTGFIRAYGEVNAQSNFKLLETFNKSFLCELNCQELTGAALEECDLKYKCIKSE